MALVEDFTIVESKKSYANCSMGLKKDIGEFKFFNQNRFTSHTYAKFQYIPSRSLRDYEILMQYMSRVFPLCIHLYFKIGTYYTNCGIARFNLLTSKLIFSVFVSNERPLKKIIPAGLKANVSQENRVLCHVLRQFTNILLCI